MRGRRIALLSAVALLLGLAAVAFFQRNVVAPELSAGPPSTEVLTGGQSTSIDLRDLPQVATGGGTPTRDHVEERHGPRIIPQPKGQAAPVGAGVAQGPLAPAPSPLPSPFEGMHLTESCGARPCGDGHPPDTNGDVGPNHYIQTINTAVAVYSKSGTRLAAFHLDDLMSQGDFGNLCDTDNFGDPVVLYDTFHDRWIVTDFAFQVDPSTGDVVSPPGAYQCFAVSMTGNPVSGGWRFYSLHIADALQDYPKFGIWPDGLYMSANMFAFPAGGSFQGVRVWALNLAQMEAGGAPPPQAVSFNVSNYQVPGGNCTPFTLLPSNARMQTGTPPAGRPNLFASVWCFANRLDVWKFHVDWQNTGSSTFSSSPTGSSTATSFSPGPNLVPSKSGNTLDTLTWRLMMQNQYTNIAGVESLWNSHTVAGSSSSQAAVRWYQVPVTGGTVGNAVQASTWNPTADNRFMPSLAVNRLGDMAIGYSVSSSTLFPAIRYAGRLAGDPVNTLSLTEQSLIEGGGSQSGNCGPEACHRWGDYSAMSLDPDGCTFWYTNMYYASTGLDHHTRIGSFRYAGCAPQPYPSFSPIPTVTPTGGATATPSASPTPTPTKSPSPTPTQTPSPTPTASPSPTPTHTPTPTPTATASPTATPTQPPQDTTPPTVSAPVAVIALNVQLHTTSASVPVFISWSASDASGIASYVLQQSKDGAAFTTITLNSPTDKAITVFKTPAHTYRFRVQATDTKGNTSAFASGPTLTLSARQETSASISYVGTWTLGSPAGAFGGSVKYAKTSTARATFTFTGRSVAWVSQMSSNRGIADVYVDGVFVKSVDLFSATTKPRMTVFTRSWATSGTHTVQIRIKATLNRPRGDIDAFAFLK